MRNGRSEREGADDDPQRPAPTAEPRGRELERGRIDACEEEPRRDTGGDPDLRAGRRDEDEVRGPPERAREDYVLEDIRHVERTPGAPATNPT